MEWKQKKHPAACPQDALPSQSATADGAAGSPLQCHGCLMKKGLEGENAFTIHRGVEARTTAIGAPGTLEDIVF